MEVFRALANVSGQPLMQVPQMWTRLQPAFQSLEPDGRPEIAAALSRAQVAGVDKVWTELAYEAVRTEVGADRPSRLDSLFCFADVFEAFAFTETTGEARFVVRGVVEENVPWAVVDMAKFAVVAPASGDADGYAEAWEIARAQAYGYWAPDASTSDVECAEILVAGPALFEDFPLRLLPTMRGHGLIL